MRSRWCLGAVVVIVLLGTAGGVAWWRSLPDAYSPPTEQATATLDVQARAVLAQWEAAHPSVPDRVFVPLGDRMPGQAAAWTSRAGHDLRTGRDELFDRAISSGRIAAAVALPAGRPAAGTVRWDDGGTVQVTLVSAAQAFSAAAAQSCQAGCDVPELRVTGAQLGAIPLRTAHGWASVPAWLFDVEDTTVQIAQVAVQSGPAPGPAADSFHHHDAEYARVSQALLYPGSATSLTVEFVGAPPGDGPCSGEYVAHAMEAASAVVVIVQPQRRPDQGVQCKPLGPFGPMRRATVLLTQPLGDKVLLDLSDGQPRMLTRMR